MPAIEPIPPQMHDSPGSEALSLLPQGSTLPRRPSSMFDQLAEVIYGAGDFEAIYAAIVRTATEVIPGCDHASLLLRDGDGFTTAAASDEVAAAVDDLERRFSEGPCLDAATSEQPRYETDFAAAHQWPRLSAAVVRETIVRCGAGFRIVVDETKVGALNLMGDEAGSLTEGSVDQGIVLAAFASVAIAAVRHRNEAETLARGLDSNREIGKAIGLIMAVHSVDDGAALELLRKASMDMNLRLAEVAKQVVDHHRSERRSAIMD